MHLNYSIFSSPSATLKNCPKGRLWTELGQLITVSMPPSRLGKGHQFPIANSLDAFGVWFSAAVSSEWTTSSPRLCDILNVSRSTFTSFTVQHLGAVHFYTQRDAKKNSRALKQPLTANTENRFYIQIPWLRMLFTNYAIYSQPHQRLNIRCNRWKSRQSPADPGRPGKTTKVKSTSFALKCCTSWFKRLSTAQGWYGHFKLFSRNFRGRKYQTPGFNKIKIMHCQRHSWRNICTYNSFTNHNIPNNSQLAQMLVVATKLKKYQRMS